MPAAEDKSDVDFSAFPHFNVDYADVLLGPYIDPKTNANKSSKSVPTGCQCSTKTTQTALFNPLCDAQTSLLKEESKIELPKTEGVKLMDKLQQDDLWEKFAEVISQNRQCDSFVKLVRAIATDKLKTSNLSWKCTLDMAKLVLCKSTTNMMYDPECVEFFSLFALMFGLSAVDVLHGPGHFLQVITEKTVFLILPFLP